MTVTVSSGIVDTVATATAIELSASFIEVSDPLPTRFHHHPRHKQTWYVPYKEPVLPGQQSSGYGRNVEAAQEAHMNIGDYFARVTFQQAQDGSLLLRIDPKIFEEMFKSADEKGEETTGSAGGKSPQAPTGFSTGATPANTNVVSFPKRSS
jgi:hypothetical protein